MIKKNQHTHTHNVCLHNLLKNANYSCKWTQLCKYILGGNEIFYIAYIHGGLHLMDEVTTSLKELTGGLATNGIWLTWHRASYFYNSGWMKRQRQRTRIDLVIPKNNKKADCMSITDPWIYRKWEHLPIGLSIPCWPDTRREPTIVDNVFTQRYR